jgi:hypothetical protein
MHYIFILLELLCVDVFETIEIIMAIGSRESNAMCFSKLLVA